MPAYLQIGSIAKSTITPLNFIDLEESLRLKASAAHFFSKTSWQVFTFKKDSEAGRNLRPEIMYSPVKIVLFSFQLYIFNHIPQHSHFPYNATATSRCTFRMMAIECVVALFHHRRALLFHDVICMSFFITLTMWPL